MTYKTLSIITITYNNPDLKKTLDSVKSQTINPQKIEHIIVDNLSTDNTPKIVENYKNSVKYKVIYIREKDNGRYQAMNKGIHQSAGDNLLFLNAGDSLHQSSVLTQAIPQLNAEIVYGDIKGHSLKNFKINWQFFIDRTFFHQATFIKKTLFDKFGLYNENLIISSDFDFFIKAVILHHATTKYLPLVVTDYDPTGISSQKSDLVYQERSLVLYRYVPLQEKFYHLLKFIYYKNKKYLPIFIVSHQQNRLNSQPKI